jgi:hypothetical protein
MSNPTVYMYELVSEGHEDCGLIGGETLRRIAVGQFSREDRGFNLIPPPVWVIPVLHDLLV